jgi:hypothetical protein
MSRSLPHSSRASTTRSNGDWIESASSIESGWRIRCFHCSRGALPAISGCSATVLLICCLNADSLLDSCTAILVKNLSARLTSPPPREKKKLAPSRFLLSYMWATVRAMVDFPVPAMPFSQKMHRLSSPSAHAIICSRTSTRVLGRQRGSCWSSKELKAAPEARGSFSSRSSSRMLTLLLLAKLRMVCG